MVVLALFPPVVAAGQQEDSRAEEQKLDETVVWAKKDAVPVYVDNVIVGDELERASIQDSIIQALRNQAGIQLRRSSFAGTDSRKVRLRGFDETRFRVLVDGLPFKRDGSYGGGPVDWSVITADFVERIEIVRGAGPAKFGDTLGGTINIVTKRPSEEAKTVVSSSYGSLDTWDSRFSHMWKVGPVGWVLSANHYETDGYLRNNDYERNQFFGKLTVDLPWELELGGAGLYSDAESGMPVYNLPDSPYYRSGYPDSESRELGGPGVGARLLQGDYGWGDGTGIDDVNSFFNVYLNKDFEFGKARIAYLQWNQEREETFRAAGDGHVIYKRETEGEDHNWEVVGDAEFVVGDHDIEAGFEIRRYGWGDQDVSFIDTSVFSGAINSPYFQFIKDGFKGQPDCLEYNALYLQDRWTLHPMVELEAGLRMEWFKANEIDPDAFGYPAGALAADMDEFTVDPRIGVTVKPWEGGAITGRFGITHRYPTSPEYFWWYLNRSSNYFNTGFSVEESYQYEVGIEQEFFDFLTAKARYYYYDIDDYIASTSVRGVGTVVYNIGEVTINGFELELGADLPYGFHIWGNFTYQDSEKDDDPWDTDNQFTSQLPDFPEKMFNFGIEYKYEEVFSAEFFVNYVDSREHFDGTDLEELDSYILLNFNATYRFWECETASAEAFFAAENITDEDYEEREGYPQPGVSVLGGMKFRF